MFLASIISRWRDAASFYLELASSGTLQTVHKHNSLPSAAQTHRAILQETVTPASATGPAASRSPSDPGEACRLSYSTHASPPGKFEFGTHMFWWIGDDIELLFKLCKRVL